jgi:CPA2 family monovalent cation:H+ antiporter-2
MPSPQQFLANLAMVLCVAAITTVVFQRFRLPVVTGYLLAGLLIGPHVPTPLVANEQVVEMLSQLGVVLLMFSIGLDLDLRTVARVGTSGGVTAIFEVGVLFSLGYIAGRQLGGSAQASLFTGAIVSMSSTTVVAKTFAEQGIVGKVRELVYGVLIVEDLIAILLLAGLTTLTSGGDTSPLHMVFAAGRLLGFLGGLLVVGLLMVPRLVRAVVKLDRPETTVITAVGLCFASALLAQRFGYSVALGAFIAGLCVAESGERKKVEPHIAPIRDVFVAIFFVAVGMQIEPHAIVDHWGATLALVALVMIGKSIAVSIGAFLVGAGVRPSVQAGLGLAQIGEFSFIIAALGVSSRAADRSLYPIAVAVSTVTSFATPWLIRASVPIAKWVDRKLPRRIQTFAALHGSWIERLRGLSGARSRSMRLGRRLLLDAACLGAVIIVTSVWLPEVGALLIEMARISPSVARLAVIAFSCVLAAPLVFGMVRLSRDLGVKLAVEVLPVPNRDRVDLAAAPRGLFVLTLQLTCMLAVGVPLVAITQPFLPAFYAVGGLVVLLLSAGVFFWRSAANLDGHVRAGAQILVEALAAPVAASSDGVQLDQLLPGLGAPTPIRLVAGSVAIGRTLGGLNLRGLTGATVLAIRRGDGGLIVPSATETMCEDDVLALAGSSEAIAEARQLLLGV